MSSWLIFIIFCVLAYSISNHFVYAHGPMHIFDWIRSAAASISENLGELFQCMICFPFWVGLGLSLCDVFLIDGEPLTPFNMIAVNSPMPWWVIAFLDAMFTSGIVWLIHTYQEKLERSWKTEDE